MDGIAFAVMLGGLIVAGGAVWAAREIATALREWRREEARDRLLRVIATFAPGAAAASADPRALLVWHPLAQAARGVLPEEFAALDRAAGRAFPFSREQVDAAHAAWTAAWLAWERAHDAEYKLKAQTLAASLGADAQSPVGRARLDAVEREKVEQYQQRYEEYTRIAKALQRLTAF